MLSNACFTYFAELLLRIIPVNYCWKVITAEQLKINGQQRQSYFSFFGHFFCWCLPLMSWSCACAWGYDFDCCKMYSFACNGILCKQLCPAELICFFVWLTNTHCGCCSTAWNCNGVSLNIIYHACIYMHVYVQIHLYCLNRMQIEKKQTKNI